jgi:TDG/mug DNA glycosylase family protein
VVDRPTLEVYERRAGEWAAARTPDPTLLTEAGRLRRRADRAGRTERAGRPGRADRAGRAPGAGGRGPAAGIVADLGCGPGAYLGALGPPAVAVDASAAMAALARAAAPGTPVVRADLASLPFRAGSLAAAWAIKSYVHLDRRDVPLALAELHRALRADAPVGLLVFRGDDDFATGADDDFPGRRFSFWPAEQLRDVLDGAGFEVESLRAGPRPGSDIVVRAVRRPTLPDFVAPGMRVLFCGLNPSVHAALRGVPYVSPGNRFWPAARAAGLVAADRDPWQALRSCGVGSTDLVKRATPRAGELRPAEFRAGVGRVERLVAWLRPRAVCFVGLSGYRTAVQRDAGVGWQPRPFGSSPAYVMPSTSGLNARTSLASLADHLRQVADATR